MMPKKSAGYNVHLKKAAIMEHAAAVKRYSKAQSGFKTGHERAVNSWCVRLAAVGAQ